MILIDSVIESYYIESTNISLVGFWIKTDVYREHPEVHFKHQLLMVAELEGEGDYVTYSTYQTYNVLQQAKIRMPIISVSVFFTVHNGNCQKSLYCFCY